MHTWARKGIALAVSGVLTVGMAASLPFGSLADAADEDIIFQAEGEDLDGATTWTDIYGQQFPGYSGSGFCYLTGETLTFEVEAPEDGMYEFTTRSAQILDKDGREQTISINGSEFMMKMLLLMLESSGFSFGHAEAISVTNLRNSSKKKISKTMMTSRFR